MEASPRYLEPERGQLGRRRGHVPQISISDDSHHVTEAIGDMYGDYDWSGRPLSFAPSPPPEPSPDQKSSYFDNPQYSPTSTERIPSKLSNEKYPGMANGSPSEGRQRQSSLGSSHGGSPPPRLSRTNSADTANQAFPLNDIDYESSPAAVAQELSNLQAIRRMSMNVDVADPDLPSFGPSFSVPAAPSHSAGEDDAARMFWVPARLHPELAPTEFKTFVEDRVERIKRRSGEENTLAPDGTERRRSSSGSLSRRKSMLSKTIDSPIGWEDGADVLERKRSQSSQTALDFSDTTLQELEQLVTDPTELVRKLSIDSSRRSLESGGSEAGEGSDMPILPSAPGGQSLKRSTRTNYRRGSLRKGERVPLSRRVAQRLADGEQDDSGADSPTSRRMSDDPPEPGLSRVQTEPIAASTEGPDNFSLPTRKGRPAPLQSSTSLEDIHNAGQTPDSTQQPVPQSAPSTPSKQFHSRLATNGRTTAPLPGYTPPTLQTQHPPQPQQAQPAQPAQQAQQALPQIVETPPHETWQATQPPPFNHVQNLPERKSSHEYSRQQNAMYNRTQERPQPASARPIITTRNAPTNQTLDDMANSPSLMLGTSTRTDSLSFIPTFSPTEEKKSDKKSKDRRDSGDSSASRKGSWGWLLGSQSQDSDKEKKDKEEKESSKKSKSKHKQPVDKAHDSTRLDVLKTATDGSRGRESLVLDRESVKLEEERKKESSRKSNTGDSKKETGIFSSLFGGGKKKGDRESALKKPDKEHRLSPEPPRRSLRADIDYNWTRFSILEERAIYRMAHIKLANPRRALYSQVLLSNFMYSYLAKVQQMHPQIQIPQFVTQRQSQKGKEDSQNDVQPEEYSQWQRYQEEHEQLAQNDDPSASPGFVDDYDPQHQQQEDTRHQYAQVVNGNDKRYGQQESAWDNRDLYSQQGLFDDTRPPEDGDLW